MKTVEDYPIDGTPGRTIIVEFIDWTHGEPPLHFWPQAMDVAVVRQGRAGTVGLLSSKKGLYKRAQRV